MAPGFNAPVTRRNVCGIAAGHCKFSNFFFFGVLAFAWDFLRELSKDRVLNTW